MSLLGRLFLPCAILLRWRRVFPQSPTVKAEADIDIEDYLARAPDPAHESLRLDWHLARYRFALDRMPAPDRAADVGCGLGFGADVLGQAVGNVLAVDINPQVVAHADKRIRRDNVHFEVHDALSGEVPEAPYDLICAFEIIEHLEDPACALRYFRASLTPGGRLVLSTPNSTDGDTGSHPYHSCQFSQATLEALLRQHFPKVEIFSQGVPRQRQQYEERKQRNPVLNLVRQLDFLQLRRYVPWPLAKPVLEQVTHVTQESLRQEVVLITPGPHELARWTVAVCSNT